ncbi:MAG: hypothetical protein SGILL_009555, partial [Bacillariaceae sp.]
MSTKVQKSTLYYPDRAPVRVQVEVDLEAVRPDQVMAQLMNYPSWTKWYPDVQACFESTPLSKVKQRNPSYPVGSTRQINIGGVVFDEEIIAYENDADSDDRKEKVWAFSVFQTSQALVNCMVERVVLEPIYDNSNNNDNKVPVGTRVRYAAGLDIVWYLRPILKPIMERSMKQSWRKGFLNLR